MCYYEDSSPLLPELTEKLRGLLHMLIVKTAGGLVKEEYIPPRSSSTGNSHTLLLTARKAHGMAVCIVLKVKAAEYLPCLSFVLIRQTYEHLLKHAVREQLVVNVLHDHEYAP